MFKVLCLIALVACAYTQDTVPVDTAAPVAPVDTTTPVVTDAAQDNAATIQTAVDNSVGDLTVGDVAANPVDASTAVVNALPANTPHLSAVNIGWENQGVQLTPAAGSEADNWWSNWEVLDVERAVATNGENEWSLNWVNDDGQAWALWNQNGEIVLVDWENHAVAATAGAGSAASLGPQIAGAAEQIVDNAWANPDQKTVASADLSNQVSTLVDNVWATQALQNYLATQGQSAETPVSDVVASVVQDPTTATDATNTVAADPEVQAAVDASVPDATAAPADAAPVDAAPVDVAAPVDAATVDAAGSVPVDPNAPVTDAAPVDPNAVPADVAAAPVDSAVANAEAAAPVDPNAAPAA